MRTLVTFCVLLTLGGLGTSLAQQEQPPVARTQAPPSNAALGQEFPIVMQQKVVAGKTPAGTQIKANVVIATLMNGKVIPRNAVLSGEVIESQARSSSNPSRLSILMDSIQWKNGSAAIHVYLTPWYYPIVFDAGPDLRYGPEQTPQRTWNGMGQYPVPNSPAYRPFPAAADSGSQPSSDTPSSVIAKQPSSMKDVECHRDPSGRITLIGSHSNLKLDNLTTYIFASSDLLLGPAK